MLPKKHPVMMVQYLSNEEMATFEEFEELLKIVPVNCDAEIVEAVASKLRGGAGPSGMDVIVMKNWLPWHG